jgi:hypothetical protein
MRLLVLNPGAVWLWIAIAGWGCAGSMVAGGGARLGAAWSALCILPLGLILTTLAALPALATAPPPVAPILVAAIGGLAATLGAVRAGVLAIGPWPSREFDRNGALRLPVRWPAAWPQPHLPAALALAAVAVLCVVVSVAAARYARAVLVAAPFPAVLGEPSIGDLGLHTLRVGLLAKQGVPPVSPLDPDYPLQYRYAFHVLAALVGLSAGLDPVQAVAATSGLVLAAVASAGAGVAYAAGRSWPAAAAGGGLAALYGPSYWLEDALRFLLGGVWPSVAAFSSLMGGRWSLGPFTSSFPSMLSAHSSSPGLPMGLLAWLALLLCLPAVFQPARRRALAAGLAGLCLGALAFAADFFVPFAVFGLCAAALAAAGGRHTWSAHAAWRRTALWAAMGTALALAVTIGLTRQLGAAGAAQGVGLTWNDRLGITPVYGGNHALLAGGQSVPLPNWVAVHDWGLLYWPGAIAGLIMACRIRRPLLAAGVAAPFASALFWHFLTVSYRAGIDTDQRVQMYRFASLAVAGLAPFLPVVVAALPRLTPPIKLAGIALIALVGGGAGIYLVAGALSLPQGTPFAWAGDVALARRLAVDPGDNRLALLGGPDTFLGMYNQGPGPYVPLWWAFGATPIPAGWDFGHPERYQPLYRRVVVSFDPTAAAELRLTHVALAPETTSSPALRDALDAFLTRCDGRLVAEWDSGGPAWRRLYRIDPVSCAGQRRSRTATPDGRALSGAIG